MLRRFAVFFVTFGLVSSACAANASSSLQGENLFPPGPLHCHASCVVELADGDLLACWFYGSGERTADDVRVEGARLKRGAKAWGQRFTMADTKMPIDITFYDGNGKPLGTQQMVPCPGTDLTCPTYGPDRAYRYALETEQGKMLAGSLSTCA